LQRNDAKGQKPTFCAPETEAIWDDLVPHLRNHDVVRLSRGIGGCASNQNKGLTRHHANRVALVNEIIEAFGQ
jgi:hypothetical protein